MNDMVASSTGAAVAGLGSYALTSLGIEPAPLFWALIGASLGMSFAAAASRVRASIVFVAVVLVCSLFGAWLAQHFSSGEKLSRNVFACVLAIAFHPLLNAAVTRIPKALDGLMARLGLGEKP